MTSTNLFAASGSFFEHYPRHRTLISINKQHTGKVNREFNERHDWNSLLSDDPALHFGRFSADFFPQVSATKLSVLPGVTAWEVWGRCHGDGRRAARHFGRSRLA